MVSPAHMKGSPVLMTPWACPGVQPALKHPAGSAGRMEQKFFFCRDFSLIAKSERGEWEESELERAQ